MHSPEMHSPETEVIAALASEAQCATTPNARRALEDEARNTWAGEELWRMGVLGRRSRTTRRGARARARRASLAPPGRMLVGSLLLGVAACASAGGGATEGTPPVDVEVRGLPQAGFSEAIPGTTHELEFAAIPPGRLAGEPVEGFFISTTEVPWIAYLAMVFEAEDAAAQGDWDGFSRPSKPYINIDRGWGQQDEPVISISLKGARAFCEWLTRHTGRVHRLPTEREWEYAARAGSSAPWSTGPRASALTDHAWFDANSGGRTRVVDAGEANPFGLRNIHGNAAEWVAEGWLVGGSYRDEAADLAFGKRKKPSPAWNASDPQIPKSTWWLADAPFAGLRVVCEQAP
jgi:hypothetical protein